MKYYKTPDFATEPDFHLLFAPLPDDDYKQLEQDILSFGCTTPILIWHNHIIDGTKRYEICKKHTIPFSTKYQLFESKEA